MISSLWERYEAARLELFASARTGNRPRAI
jgi:hypothetical protein